MSVTICGKEYDIETTTELKLMWKKFKKIPEEVFQLINLRVLDLSYNNIQEISDEINKLINLEVLIIENNNIKEITTNLFQLTNLRNLDLNYNQINKLPEEIGQLINLQELFLRKNNIRRIPKSINNLVNLKKFHFTENEITFIPIEIIELHNIRELYYHGCPIENLVNPIIDRFIKNVNYLNLIENRAKRTGNINFHNFYTDTQNVHSSSIQTSVKDSIFNLLRELTDEKYKYNYLIDDILTEQCKLALTEYCSDKSIHGILQCTFEEVMNSVFIEISKMDIEMQKQVKQRMNEEMADALCMCFTGRLSRLVNSLSGYSDKVFIKISDSEEIGNIIVNMKKKGGDVRSNVEKELLERGYERTVIDEWLSYVD